MNKLNGKQITAVPVARDEDGFWTHPNFPEWHEGTTRDEVDTFFSELNLGYVVYSMEFNAPDELVEKYFEDGDCGCVGWDPECDKEGAFLLSIHDTEDGPVAIFAYPLELDK